MNRDKPEKIDKRCNVCGSKIELGSAWSQCSNRDCITRNTKGLNKQAYDHLPKLSTDATDEEIATYWEARALAAEDDGPTQDEIDEAVVDAYEAFKTANREEVATAKNGALKALLPFSSYAGFGELRMEVKE